MISSLSSRVIWICLSFIIIPLFLHSIYLYRVEYRETYRDAEMTLRLICEAQSALIRERIYLQWNRLDAVDSEANRIAQQLGIIAIVPPQGVKSHFAIADRSYGGLVVGKIASPHKALALITPFPELLKEIAQIEQPWYPVAVALLDNEGKVLAGNVQTPALKLDLSVDPTNFSLHLSLPTAAIASLHFSFYLYRFLTLLFFIGILGGALVFLLIRRISRPLHQLCRTLDRVSEGAVHARYQPDKMGFEINELGQEFNRTLDALLLHQNRAEQERLGREKLAQELKIGRNIQFALFPQQLPAWTELDVATGFLPAMEVSGDFYDLFSLAADKLLIVVADTEGKGIPACLYALGFRSLLRSAAFAKQDLAAALLEANHLFWLDVQQSGTFLTAWTAIYDRESQILTYCSMGHPPALLKRDGHLQELGTEGIAFGAQDCHCITTQQIKLKSADVLVLYTDGILESHNADGERFARKRLHEILDQADPGVPSEQIVESVLEEIRQFSGGEPQFDDITCVVLRMV